jgi:hypothetical protein
MPVHHSAGHAKIAIDSGEVARVGASVYSRARDRLLGCSLTGLQDGACAVVRLACVTDYVRLSAADTVAHLSNPAFDAATFEIWGVLLSGARIAVIPREAVVVMHGDTDAVSPSCKEKAGRGRPA